MTFKIRPEAEQERIAQLFAERTAITDGSVPITSQEDADYYAERVKEIDRVMGDLGSSGPTPFRRPRTDNLDIGTWIERHEMFGTAYMDGMREIGTDMIARDEAMRNEVRAEGELKEMEAEIIIESMYAIPEASDKNLFADCKNDRQRDVVLTHWKHTDPDYLAVHAELIACKAERSRLEASIRMRELACSVIKRDMEFGTAVVRTMGGE